LQAEFHFLPSRSAIVVWHFDDYTGAGKEARMASARRMISIFLVCMTIVAAPAQAAVECLTDAEIMILVRSVYTRAIGRVMRICADSYPRLDQRAITATTDFLTIYAEPMRRNRLAANELMARIYENWEYAFAQFLAQGTSGDEAWAQGASESECLDEIDRLTDLAALDNYDVAMTNDRTRRQFESERPVIAKCE
jgi:hypothetical protein